MQDLESRGTCHGPGGDACGGTVAEVVMSRVGAMDTRAITVAEATDIIDRHESHFWDVKSRQSPGKVIQKIACSLANADGGDFAIGIEDQKVGKGMSRWVGFADIEAGNHVLQALSTDVKPPVPYSAEWLSVEGFEDLGYVCLVSVRKSGSVHETADGSVLVRRSAASVKLDGAERVNLALSKGVETYENQELADYKAAELAEEPELLAFLAGLSPRTAPEEFLRKQRLVTNDTGNARLSGAVLFAESPPAVIPKRCAVKVARYETKVENPERKHLRGSPLTIEGPARQLIENTISAVQEMIQSVSVLTTSGTMEKLSYPPEALKEVIVNAVIHRDYNVSDDIVIRVFDNRVEVKSPGRLPGHMTLNNLLTDRFSRNPTINRLINKYPDPPNKDIGEGLKTTMRSMADARLKAPTFALEDNYFVVRIEHTPLARPQEIVMEYLGSHTEITNRIARQLTGINSENSMKDVFLALRNAEFIERVPEKLGNKSAWRLVQGPSAPMASTRGRRSAQRSQPKRLTRAQRRCRSRR